MSTKSLPDFRAYTIVKREGQKDFWIPLGAAFLHQDGAGMNLLLQATPLDGKIILRPFDNEAERNRPLNPTGADDATALALLEMTHEFDSACGREPRFI